MPVTLTGTKTVTRDASPHITAAVLTSIMAIAVENLTIAQFRQIESALSRCPYGGDTTKTIGSLLT